MFKGVVSVVVVLVVVNCATAGLVDQSQELIGNCWFAISPDWKIGQTFTAGMTGQLDAVDLYFENVFDAEIYPCSVSIVSVNNGVPEGSVLGEALAGSLTTGMNNVDFSASSIYVTAGTQYGIVVTNTDAQYCLGQSAQWRGTDIDVYAGGSSWLWKPTVGWTLSWQPPPGPYSQLETYFDKDATFRTYVTVPIPSSLLLVSLGGFCLLKRKIGFNR